jgi:hypothetical protein
LITPPIQPRLFGIGAAQPIESPGAARRSVQGQTLALLETNYGRNADWWVELDGRRLARLTEARWVQADLLAGGIAADRGRDGMSGDQLLRALVIKQANGFSYE